MFCFKCSLVVTGYVNKLLERLHSYVSTSTAPTHKDRQVATMASQGPQYTSLDELEEKMAEKRWGLQLKPHYVSEGELQLAEQRTAKAKRAIAKKSKWPLLAYI